MKKILLKYNMFYAGVWLSLVERLVRDQEVAGSNPVTPTTIPKGFTMKPWEFFQC